MNKNIFTFSKRTFVILSVCIILGLIAAFFAIWNVQNYQEQQIKQQQNELSIQATIISNGINGIFKEHYKILKTLASEPDIIHALLNKETHDFSKEICSLENLLVHHQPEISSVTIIDKNGFMLHSHPLINDSIIDCSDKEDVAHILKEEEALISNVFVNLENKPAISISNPVFSKNNFIGIVRITVYMEIFKNLFFTPIEIENRTVAILNSRGDYIYHSDKYLLNKNYKDVILEYKAKFPNQSWKEIEDMMGKVYRDETGMSTFYNVNVETNKIQQRIAVYRSTRILNKTFYIIVCEDYKSVMMPTRRYIRKFGFFILVILVLLSIVTFTLLNSRRKRLLLLKENEYLKEIKDKTIKIKEQRDEYLLLIEEFGLQNNALIDADLQIQKNEKYLRSIFKSASIGIGVVKDRVLSFVNERFCEITGYEEKELINKSAKIIYPTIEEYERVGKYKYEQIKLLGTGTVETIFKRKDGELINVILSSSPIDIEDLSKGVTFTVLDITKRKQAETALRQSEEKFKAFFENNKAAILQINSNTGNIINANNAAKSFYQYSGEEFLDKTLYDINILSREVLKGKIDLAIKEKTNFFISKHRLASGEIRDVEIYTTPIKIKDEVILFTIVHDITQRIEAEKSLKESKETQDKILDAFEDGVYLCSSDYKIQYLNTSMKNEIGYDAVGEKCHKAIYNSNEICSWCYFNELKSKEERKVSIEIERNKRFYVVSSMLLKDKSKLTVYYDITSRKKAEIELIESEAKFRMLFNTANEAIFVINNNMEFIEVNDEAVKRYGYSRKEFLAMQTHQLSPSKIDMKTRKEIDKLFKSERMQFVHKHKKADGTVFPVEISTRKIIYNNETGFLVFVHDISEREQQQQLVFNAAIQAEEKERARVASDIHDGVSPMLSALKIYIQSLKKHKKKEIVDEIHKRIEYTIDETLEGISEISNNLSPHILRNFGLVKAIESFSKKIKGIKFDIKANDIEDLEMNTETTLYRVTTELINNTLKHSKASKISINIHKGTDVKYTYKDNGQGFNIDNTVSHGMGLFNLSNRIHSINGSINFINKNGIKVVITIPVIKFSDKL